MHNSNLDPKLDQNQPTTSIFGKSPNLLKIRSLSILIVAAALAGGPLSNEKRKEDQAGRAACARRLNANPFPFF